MTEFSHVAHSSVTLPRAWGTAPRAGRAFAGSGTPEPRTEPGPGAVSAAQGAEPVAPGPPEPVCCRGAPWPGPSLPPEEASGGESSSPGSLEEKEQQMPELCLQQVHRPTKP
ncbi:lactosylceramide 1,3-N-acetyl-beta-D-glucosaminyltransferase isoform X4 [Motacilla alba alba]|uniref:lactosylceramide 1,3-N-acetyl-beta-D-glucosaminyltransferase isoform X4 n=1 Tax=Motacilla alba alba TaxID=1094192 RepID=UPI0018D544D7|nr:lactosylceramide 1,3-N-acetyl-beta-D-glucosaminyltransferase isoform X4 [Motacilla alba alba]